MEQRYTNLTPIQLAGEHSFIRWIYEGTNDQAWREWLSAHPSMDPIVQEARRIVNDLKQEQVYRMSEGEKLDLWNRIDSSVQATRKTARKESARVRSLARTVIAIAASLALIIWITLPKNTSTTSIGAAEQRTITLPDQSEITINAGSVVTYAPNRYGKKRTIKLEGEAFFEVQKGEQFTVETPRGSVTVLGTSFNVIARPDRFEVSCYTGKVEVKNNRQQTQLLTPGDRASELLREKNLTKQSFAVADPKPDWTRGKFVFTDQPLQVVVDELARQYNVRVMLEPGLEDMRYVGFFESGNLNQAVQLITWPLTLDAQITNNTVSITRRR